jgi:hypothetical protein
VADLRKVDAMREVAARRGLAALAPFGWLVDERRTKRGKAKSECAAKLHLDAHVMRARINGGMSVIAAEPLRALALVRFAGGFIAADARQAEAWEAAVTREHERLTEAAGDGDGDALPVPATVPAGGCYVRGAAREVEALSLATMRGVSCGVLTAAGAFGAVEVWHDAPVRARIAADAATVRGRLALASMRAEMAEKARAATVAGADLDAIREGTALATEERDKRRVMLATATGPAWPAAARAADAERAAGLALVAVSAARVVSIGARSRVCGHAALSLAAVNLGALVLVSRAAASAVRAARAATGQAVAEMTPAARAEMVEHAATVARLARQREAVEAGQRAAARALRHASQAWARTLAAK